MNKIQVTQVKSVSGATKAQRASLRSLGLRKRHQTVIIDGKPELLGMVKKVSHLVDVKEG